MWVSADRIVLCSLYTPCQCVCLPGSIDFRCMCLPQRVCQCVCVADAARFFFYHWHIGVFGAKFLWYPAHGGVWSPKMTKDRLAALKAVRSTHRSTWLCKHLTHISFFSFFFVIRLKVRMTTQDLMMWQSRWRPRMDTWRPSLPR